MLRFEMKRTYEGSKIYLLADLSNRSEKILQNIMLLFVNRKQGYGGSAIKDFFFNDVMLTRDFD